MPYILTILLNINLLKSNLIWDFDDYIQKSKEISKREHEILQKKALNIIVTSKYLRDKIDSKYRDKVILLPTTEKEYKLKNEKEIYNYKINNYDNEIDLVWVGTPVNLINLDKIINLLDNTAIKMKKDLVLKVICSKDYFYDCKKLIINNIKWSRDEAIIQMKKAHIGIMPLIEGEIQLGKGGFKLIQYMANGLPVISSNYGYNSEVVSKDCGFLCNKEEDWQNAIEYLSSDLKIWKKYSENSKKRYDEFFSYNKNKKFWSTLIKTKEE